MKQLHLLLYRSQLVIHIVERRHAKRARAFYSQASVSSSSADGPGSAFCTPVELTYNCNCDWDVH